MQQKDKYATIFSVSMFKTWAYAERGTLGPYPSPGQSQVAIGFLIHSDMDTPREAIGPFGSKCFSREVSTALMSKKGPIAVRIVWRSANVKPISAKSEQ